ncbi:MAG: glycosyltransferase family 2 protein [Candidatus Omnitrophota bacterium]|nr:MAG: glycosyltransferase family 2 protein [Candidatus Omnitrophota bacterium]
MKNSISVVLPAYNEEENIAAVINCIYEFLQENFSDFEIIVVDDGSYDNTYQECLKVKEGLGQRIKLLKHDKNRGYGVALRTGLFSADKDLIFYTDADNQFDITEINKFTSFIPEYDLVIGFREDRQDKLIRKLVSFVYNKLILFIFGLKAKDIDCSFKLFKRESLHKLSIERDQFFVDTEVLIKAYLNNFKIKELPVKHLPRKLGKSTVKFTHIFTTLGDIFSLHNSLKGARHGSIKKA